MIEERRCADLDRPEKYFGMSVWELVAATIGLAMLHQTLQNTVGNIFLIFACDAIFVYTLVQVLRFLEENTPAGWVTDLVYWLLEPVHYTVRNDTSTLPTSLR